MSNATIWATDEVSCIIDNDQLAYITKMDLLRYRKAEETKVTATDVREVLYQAWPNGCPYISERDLLYVDWSTIAEEWTEELTYLERS